MGMHMYAHTTILLGHQVRRACICTRTQPYYWDTKYDGHAYVRGTQPYYWDTKYDGHVYVRAHNHTIGTPSTTGMHMYAAHNHTIGTPSTTGMYMYAHTTILLGHQVWRACICTRTQPYYWDTKYDGHVYVRAHNHTIGTPSTTGMYMYAHITILLGHQVLQACICTRTQPYYWDTKYYRHVYVRAQNHTIGTPSTTGMHMYAAHNHTIGTPSTTGMYMYAHTTILLGHQVLQACICTRTQPYYWDTKYYRHAYVCAHNHTIGTPSTTGMHMYAHTTILLGHQVLQACICMCTQPYYWDTKYYRHAYVCAHNHTIGTPSTTGMHMYAHTTILLGHQVLRACICMRTQFKSDFTQNRKQCVHHIRQRMEVTLRYRYVRRHYAETRPDMHRSVYAIKMVAYILVPNTISNKPPAIIMLTLLWSKHHRNYNMQHTITFKGSRQPLGFWYIGGFAFFTKIPPYGLVTTQQTHYAIMTSLLRQNDVVLT